MKLALFAAAAMAVTSLASAAPVLILTEIMDGDLTGGTPKAAEVTNVGDATADLSQYKIANYNNGSTTAGTVLTLSGSLAAGQSIVIASEGTTSASVFGAAPAFTTNALNVNGDDCVAILNLSDVVLDVYGVIGVDGTGANWEHLDSYATRLSTVSAIVPSGPTFDVTRWNVRPVAALDTLDLAAHQALFGASVPDTGFGNFPVPSSSVSDWTAY